MPDDDRDSNVQRPTLPTKRGSEYVYDALVRAGIDVLVGIPGTQTLPLDRTVAERDEIRYVMARHETAVPHIAWGYYEASGSLAATLTVPGPGDTNVMHGLKNAAEDCVPIIHISADVNPDARGKKPIHEIEPDTFDNVVKENVVVDRPIDLQREIARAIGLALTPPYGPVRVGVASTVLESSVYAPPATVSIDRSKYDSDAAYGRAVDVLAEATRPILYVGGGARRAADGPRVVRDLVDELDAPVLASPKGKGVVPEDDPRVLGVTGSHLPAGARTILEAADVMLALGTDFDGVSTDGWSLPMGEWCIHVTLDPGAIDTAYEADVPIVEDVGVAGDRLLERLSERKTDRSWNGERLGQAVRTEYVDRLEDRGLFDGDAPANTPELLAALRDVLPRETIVTTDVGGFRLWALQTFEAYDPGQFVTAGSWAGMGVGLPAAIGAKLTRPDRPVVSLTGDGGLMMCVHELHTAAEYDLDIVVVVSNNSDYGVISKSPKITQYADDHEFTWNSPSFVAVAEGFGCRARAVDTVAEAVEAMEWALDVDGPVLLDVAIDQGEPSAAAAAEYDTGVSIDQTVPTEVDD